MMKKIKLLFILTLCVITTLIGAWVVQDNSAEFAIVLLGFPIGQLPAGLWLLIFFFSGFLVGQCVVYPTVFNLKRKRRRDGKLMRRLEAECIEAQKK